MVNSIIFPHLLDTMPRLSSEQACECLTNETPSGIRKLAVAIIRRIGK